MTFEFERQDWSGIHILPPVQCHSARCMYVAADADFEEVLL